MKESCSKFVIRRWKIKSYKRKQEAETTTLTDKLKNSNQFPVNFCLRGNAFNRQYFIGPDQGKNVGVFRRITQR
jgi:hypothetical protein